MLLQETSAGEEVLEDGVSVEFPLHGPAFVVVARVSAQRRQSVRTQGDEVRGRKAPDDVLDVGVQAPVLVNDQYGGLGAAHVGRGRHVAAHRSGSVRRVVLDVLGTDPFVLRVDLTSPLVPGSKTVQEHRRRHTPDRETGRSVQESASIDHPVHVLVEQAQDLFGEVARFHSVVGHDLLLEGFSVSCHMATSNEASKSA